MRDASWPSGFTWLPLNHHYLTLWRLRSVSPDISNYYYKLPLTWHLIMLLVDILTIQCVVIMHACVNQRPYYHLITLEHLILDFRKRCHLYWKDCFRMIKLLFHHKKPSCKLIYFQNILSTIPLNEIRSHFGEWIATSVASTTITKGMP